jgi:membrane protein
MSRLSDAWRRVRHAAIATPGLRVILLAIRNYVLHQSANQAGSLAFSWVLAMFPLPPASWGSLATPRRWPIA